MLKEISNHPDSTGGRVPRPKAKSQNQKPKWDSAPTQKPKWQSAPTQTGGLVPKPSPATPASLSSVTWAGTTNWRGREVVTWQWGVGSPFSISYLFLIAHLPGLVCPRYSDTFGLRLSDHLFPICVPHLLPFSPSSSYL